MAGTRSVETKKVEKAAVLAVKNLIQACPTVDDKLDEDDKNILVDGPLELYGSQDMRISDFIGKIDVQVKGTTRKLRVSNRGFVKFSIEVENLRRFNDVFHGILFFCVSVHPKQYTARKVYYAQLLPYDINMLLRKAGPDQKSISVRFRPFPTDPKEITRLLMAFHKNREVQLRAEVSAYGFFDEHMTLPPGIKTFKFSTQLFPGESLTTLDGFRDGPYIYGEAENGKLTVIGKMGEVVSFAVGKTATVSAGDFSVETTLMMGDSEEGDFLEFEGVRVYLSEGTSHIDYMVSGDARKRYNTVRFVQELAKCGTILVDGQVILRGNCSTLDNEQEQRLRESVDAYGLIVDTMNALHITAAWDLDKLSEKEWSDLRLIHRLLVKKIPYRESEIKSPLVHFDIQGGRVYSIARRHNDGSYDFLSLFSDEVYFVFGESNEASEESEYSSGPVGAIAALDEEGYRKIVNLDMEQIEKTFERCPITPRNQGPLNQKLLEMLSAYDSGSMQPEALLAAASLLARKLYDADKTSDTSYLNLVQALKRGRELNETEKGRLRDIAIDNDARYMKAAAYALLDDKAMAESCLARCNEVERRQIEDYPIARFFR